MNRPVREVVGGEECVPNIGLRGRNRRRAKGVVWLALAILAFLELARRDAGGATFVLVAPFVAMASLHFFQAKEKT